MWTAEECDNLDSCAEGQKHFYPDPKDIVEVREETWGRAVGSSREIKLRVGEYTVGPYIDLQAHLVSLEIRNKLVWADAHDVHPRGPEDFASLPLLDVSL